MCLTVETRFASREFLHALRHRKALAMQAEPDESLDQAVAEALTVLSELDPAGRDRVVASILQAVYTYRATGDVTVLTTMSDDIAFTVRVQRSEHYRKLQDGGPSLPGKTGRPVADVLADLAI